MKKVLVLMVLAALSGFDVGCAPGGDSASPNNTGTAGNSADPNSTPKDGADATISDIVESHSYDPNTNTLSIEFRATGGAKIVRIQEDENKGILNDLDVKNPFLLTTNKSSESNDLRPWKIRYSVEGEDGEIKIFDIQQKKSFKISGNFNIGEFKREGDRIELLELTMARDANINTGGANIEFKIDKLKVEPGAVIQTMTEVEAKQPAKQGQPGKSGGQITITTTETEGSLEIYMRGGRGGAGMDGVDATGKGAEGAPGVDSAARQVRGPDGPQPICVRPPGRGDDGGTGPKGGDATDGIKGGSTGDLTMTFGNAHGFQYTVHYVPGEGGQGGIGGRGGPGGEGGRGGQEKTGICAIDNAARGNPGPTGNPGKNGIEGQKGNFGKFQNNPVTENVITGDFR